MSNTANTGNLHKKRGAPMQRLQRGQSLVEVAFSLTLLVLIFSGAVDLGRAFYTKIFLDSAVSEGAHFAAAYPGCLKYGTQNFLGTDNVPRQCWATNNAYWRALNESDQLDKTRFVDVAQPIGYVPLDQASCSGTTGPNRCSSDLTDIQPGDTVFITLQYRMPLITPLMRAMFGSELSLSGTTKLVVRGTGIPETYGEAQPQPTSINPVKIIKQGDQKYGQGACTNGVPSLVWQSSEVVKGFAVFPALSQDPNPAFSTTETTTHDTPENTDASGLVPESAWQEYTVKFNEDSNNTYFQQIPSLSGGSRKFNVEAYVSDGTNHYSPPFTITTFCHPVAVNTIPYLTCRVDNKGLNASWTMLSDTQGTQYLDRIIDGFGIYRGTPSSGALVGSTMTGNTTRSGSALFSSSTSDWNASSYYIQAKYGSTAVGTAYAFPSPVACTYATNLSVNINDGLTSATTGAPADYTITVSNPTGTGQQDATGLRILQSTATNLTNQQWTCVPVSNAQCSDSSSTSSGSGQLDTRVQIKTGGSVTFHITGYYPVTAGNFQMGVNVTGTPECGTGCTVTLTNNSPDSTTLISGTNVDLAISNIPNSGSTAYTPPTAITYDLIVQNTSTTVSANPVRVTIDVPSPMNPLQTTWTCTTNAGAATCPQAGPVTFSNNSIVVSGINLPASSSVKFTITTTPPSSAATNFTVQATVQPDNGSGVSDSTQTNNTVTHDYTYVSGTYVADLGLLFAGSSTYTSGLSTILVYDLYAYNRGPDAITKATITLDDVNDQLDSIGGTSNITFVCATTGTASCGTGGTGTGSYDTTTHKFVITNVQINASSGYTPPVSTLSSPLPANYVHYTISINVPATVSGNIRLSSTITGVQPAVVDAASPGLNTVTYTTVEASSIIADLGAALTIYSGYPYTPGSDITYTLTLNNTSRRSVPNASVFWTDLNSALQNVSWCQGSGCVPSNSIGTMTNLSIPARSSITLQVKGTVSQAYTANTSFTVQAQITGTVDNIQSNNTAQAVASAASFDLFTVQNSNSPDYVVSYKPNEVQTIKVKVGSNHSATVYNALFTNTFTLSDGSSASAKFANIAWTCAAFGTSSCVDGSSGTGMPSNYRVTLGSASAGAYVEFTFTLTMASNAQGTITSTGTIAAPGSLVDSNSSNNSSAVFTMKFGENLTVEWNSAPGTTTYESGDSFTYYYTVTNKGDSTVIATVADSFPANIIYSATWSKCSSSSDATCSTAGGTNTAASQTASVTTSMNPSPTITLAAGASQTIKVVLTVQSGVTSAISDFKYTVNVSGPSGYAETTTTDNQIVSGTITRTWPTVSNLAITYCKSQNKTKPTDVTFTFSNYSIKGTSTSPTSIVIADSSGTTIQTITAPSPAWTATDVNSASNGTTNGYYVNTSTGTTTVKSRSTIPNTYEGTNLTVILYSSSVKMGSSATKLEVTATHATCS